MRSAVRRMSALLVATLIASSPLLSIPQAFAQGDLGPRAVLLVTLEDATLGDLLATPGFLALAQIGGASLLVMTASAATLPDVGDEFDALPRGTLFGGGAARLDLGSMADRSHAPSMEKLDAAAEQLASDLDTSLSDSELILLTSSPPAAAEAAGDHVGALVIAEGSPQHLAAAIRAAASDGAARTLTSDSTRRVGVVASPDVAETAIAFARFQGVPDPGGELIRTVDSKPPTELLDRYVQSKRLTVPIGTAAALFAVLGSLFGIVALLWRGSPPRLRALAAWVAISSPFLALSLLLAGHLPSLTYASVIPFLVVTTAAGTLVLVPVARRGGTLAAIAAAGIVLLAALGVEAALGWTAALTPLLGGSQLDGGRFFGLPNAFIGLLLGGSIYVAQRLPRTHGAVLIAITGLFAGSPWTGANIGAAVTLFAGAGIWWGLRGDLTWWRTAAAATASVLGGTALVVLAHRYLTSAATHVTRFAEDAGGLSGIWDKLVDRLGVGTHLIASNPFALLPVAGVVVTLIAVLRPPIPVRLTFDDAPVWRLALLAILLGSTVAYVANDSGAAAIGEGFTTSLAGLLYVSLLRRNDIMETS